VHPEELIYGSARTAILQSDVAAYDVGNAGVEKWEAAEIVGGSYVRHGQMVQHEETCRTHTGGAGTGWLAIRVVVDSGRQVGDQILSPQIRLYRTAGRVSNIGDVVLDVNRDVRSMDVMVEATYGGEAPRA
jgi:hypothetical protein